MSRECNASFAGERPDEDEWVYVQGLLKVQFSVGNKNSEVGAAIVGQQVRADRDVCI